MASRALTRDPAYLDAIGCYDQIQHNTLEEMGLTDQVIPY